jgi:hypothetical protein
MGSQLNSKTALNFELFSLVGVLPYAGKLRTVDLLLIHTLPQVGKSFNK